MEGINDEAEVEKDIICKSCGKVIEDNQACYRDQKKCKKCWDMQEDISGREVIK